MQRKASIYLNEYSTKDIEQAIDKYSELYHDEHYFFSYKFTLDNFFRHIEKYLPGGQHYLSYDNFINKVKPLKEEMPIICKHKEKYDERVYQKVINMLKEIPYEEYLFSAHWKHFSGEAIKFARYKCQLCDNNNSLNVHHKNYKNLGRETFNDTIVLCNDCHRMVHNKSGDKHE
jgi:uncharacterized protein YlaI